MHTADVIVIGSGINGLVAAAHLANAGWEVEILEGNATLGGAMMTEELTRPGFHHDTFASWYPAFLKSGTWDELGDDLTRHGAKFLNVPAATASALPGGEGIVAYRDLQRTAAEFPDHDRDAYVAEIERYGDYAAHIGRLLDTELFSPRAARVVTGLVKKLGRRGTAALAGEFASSARGWLQSNFAGPEVPALAAPWILHTGLGPDRPGGGLQLHALMAMKHDLGSPVVQGGSARLVEAFKGLIQERGGRLRTGTKVEEIIVRSGRAVGVRTADEELFARRAVIANVTPTQLYLQLLPDGAAPVQAVTQARRFRYGRGGMQIHLALSEPLRWRDNRLDDVPIVHVTGGLDAITMACAQAETGSLPTHPTFAMGQPTVVDPSRAPEGCAVGWIQLQEVPFAPTGDSAGTLDTSQGVWTEALKDGYADRVLGLLDPHVENSSAVMDRTVLSPADFQARNPNFRNGDPYSGATDLDQSFVLRPLQSYGSHRTPVDGLWHCGASTFPGPGLHGGSGRIVARSLLREARLPKIVNRVRGR